MKYYFSRIHKSDLLNLSDATRLKYLKERSYKHLKSFSRELANILGFGLAPFWISRTTFGAVLCDFHPTKTGPTIIGNHKALFDLICEEVDYLVLSENLDRNIQYQDIDDKKILVININRYKKFIKTFTDKFKRIKLFLFTKLNPEEEELINNWIDSKPRDLPKGTVSSEEVIKILSKNSPEKMSKDISRLEFIKENKIISRLEIYEQQLKEFEEKVKNSNILESDLRKSLFEKMWIIDFKYNESQFEKIQEYEVGVGIIDIWISKNKIGTNNMIIELKLPHKPLTLNYRNKLAIRSEVGKGLSQLIHYLEDRKKPYKINNGVLIIGREDDNHFVDIFNQYLHGIKIKTYGQLIEDCRSIINNFKEADKIEDQLGR